MKTQKLILLILSFIFILGFIPGCDDKTPPSPSADLPEDVFIRSNLTDIVSVAVSPNADVYAATLENCLARYSPDGDLLEEFPGTEHMCGLFYANGFIYGYQAVTHDILEFDINKKTLRVVYAGLQASVIRSLAVSGNYIVLLIVPSYNDILFEAEADGYMDFKERIITITVTNGEIAEITSIRRPIVLYQGSDETLYVYAHPDSQYVLYSLNTQNGKVDQVASINDIGYINGFAYEEGVFFYFSRLSNVGAKRMSDGFVYVVANVSPLLLTGNFTRYGNYLLFIEQRQHDVLVGNNHGHDTGPAAPMTILRSIRLGPDLAVLLKDDDMEDGPGFAEINGNIVISASFSNKLFYDDTPNKNGVIATYTEQPGLWAEYQEFLTSIMAGNDNIDIYILYLNDSISRAMLEQGYYVPLTGSAPIQAYFDKCFDWVRESATAPNGDLWMLPLRFNTSVLWYVPGNFEHFDLTPSDVETLDKYYSTLERINQEKGKYTTYAQYFEMHYPFWNMQYELTYNDYSNGKVDFNTIIYRSLFDNLWTGWRRNGGIGGASVYHPVLQYDSQKVFAWYSSHDTDGYSPDYNTEHVIFKLDDIGAMMENIGDGFAEWRALPMPRISDEVKKSPMICVFAVVNPHSKNKELAVAYLETAAEDMLSAINHPVFVQKDLSAYEGRYDMSLPVFQDLYDIYRNGAVVSNLFLGNEDQSIIDDYQGGNLTLEEALEEIQRRAEFWLYE